MSLPLIPVDLLTNMSNDKTQNHSYEPNSRLVDNPEKLRKLYHEKDLTMQQIADEYASLGRTSVHNRLHEYGIVGDENEATSEVRDESKSRVEWTKYHSD